MGKNLPFFPLILSFLFFTHFVFCLSSFVSSFLSLSLKVPRRIFVNLLPHYSLFQIITHLSRFMYFFLFSFLFLTYWTFRILFVLFFLYFSFLHWRFPGGYLLISFLSISFIPNYYTFSKFVFFVLFSLLAYIHDPYRILFIIYLSNSFHLLTHFGNYMYMYICIFLYLHFDFLHSKSL